MESCTKIESGTILVGSFKNTKIFLDNSCNCIFGWDRVNKFQPILLSDKTDRIGIGIGISKLGISSLQEITWNKDMFELYGFDFDKLIIEHPLWVPK